MTHLRHTVAWMTISWLERRPWCRDRMAQHRELFVKRQLSVLSRFPKQRNKARITAKVDPGLVLGNILSPLRVGGDIGAEQPEGFISISQLDPHQRLVVREVAGRIDGCVSAATGHERSGAIRLSRSRQHEGDCHVSVE